MHLILVFALAVLFPAVHVMNAWLFDFAAISSHVSLIYLPAFLRLFYVLMLGPTFGSLTTVLGGLMLVYYFQETLQVALLNVFCSAAGPLMAMFSFKIMFKRSVALTSIRDLSFLTLIYCIFNSVLHHLAWLVTNASKVFDYQHAVFMFIGDFNGALLGAYLMKAMIDFMEQKGFNFSDSSQPKN